MKTFFIATISTLLLFSCKENSTNDRKEIDATSNKLDSISIVLDEKVPIWQKELNIPNVAIGLIDNGKVYKTKVYGKFNKNDAPKDMLFNIASITKVVFGATVMKLVNNGDWNLDEPLYKYYIDVDVKDDPRHKKLTSRHVLSQQSGFVNWRWNHPTKKLTFDFDPGTTFNYSGEGMEYLRKSIEKKLNKPWDEIADSLLFMPMNLKNTSHSWDGKSNFNRFSKFYDSEGKEHILEDHGFTANAADDVMTTIDDLSNFGANIINESYLSNDVLSDMLSKQTTINDNQDQALAWRLIRNLKSSEYAIQHGGNDIGVATLMVLLPESKRGVIVLTNADAGIVMCNNVVRTVLEDGKEIIHRAYRSGSVNDVPQSVTISNDILEAYVGIYEQPSGRKVIISSAGKTLLMKMAGVPNFQLYPESNNLFFLMDFDPKIEFKKLNNEDFVLNIIEGENSIECKKIK
jgi:CubicO group peptidase (beta-lactamase class C family)